MFVASFESNYINERLMIMVSCLNNIQCWVLSGFLLGLFPPTYTSEQTLCRLWGKTQHKKYLNSTCCCSLKEYSADSALHSSVTLSDSWWAALTVQSTAAKIEIICFNLSILPTCQNLKYTFPIMQLDHTPSSLRFGCFKLIVANVALRMKHQKKTWKVFNLSSSST